MHDARSITAALRGKWCGYYGVAPCPAHDDGTPSLKLKDDPRKSDGIDVHCFAGCPWQDVKAELIRRQLLPELKALSSPRHITLPAPVAGNHDLEGRIDLALRIWNAAGPLLDSLGFRYFTERRGLHVGLLDLDHVLRFHEGFNAVVALMTDPVTAEPCGVHRTFLNADGSKTEKKMLGRQGTIKLSPDEDVLEGLGICEGIEDGLRILLSGWAPIWVACNAGGIARLPVLSGIEALTIFRDEDEAGTKAATACAEVWAEAGREVRVASVRDFTP